MKKITLYCGLNDKNTKTQLIDTLEAFKIASNICCAYCDGATIFNATGIYKHYDGTIIIENTLRIELIDVTDDALKSIIQSLKIALNQESILKQTQNIDTEFI